MLAETARAAREPLEILSGRHPGLRERLAALGIPVRRVYIPGNHDRLVLLDPALRVKILGREQRDMTRAVEASSDWSSLDAADFELLRQIIESEEFMTFLEEDLQPQEPPIGIICMYSKQRALIDRLKSEATWLGEARKLVKVDTVDSSAGNLVCLTPWSLSLATCALELVACGLSLVA